MNMKGCDTKHDFEHVLTTAGLRVTPGRLAALIALHKRGAQSADQLVAAGGGEAFDRVTAYRILKQFLSVGIAVPAGHSDGAVRYELADHHTERVVCTRCGMSETLDACEFSKMERQALKKSHSFSKIQAHAVEFFGTCKECAVLA